MPRRGAHGAHAGIRIVEYDSPQVMGYAIKRRRGENDACGESIYTMGLQDNGAVCQKIEECTSHRDRKMPQRGDRRLYPFVNENDHREGYTNKSYVCISDDVYCGILDQIPDRGCHFCHPDWEGVGPCPPVVELNEHRKWYGEKAVKNIQKDLRHYIGRNASFRLGQYDVPITPCDDGAWVRLDFILLQDPLWCHPRRQLDCRPLNSFRSRDDRTDLLSTAAALRRQQLQHRHQETCTPTVLGDPIGEPTTARVHC